MRFKAIVVLAVAAAVLIPVGLHATITCTVSGDNPITILVVSDNTMVGAIKGEEINATIIAGTCGPLDFPTSSCEWMATQDAPGPSSVTSDFTDDDGRQTCGPFTNEDGLPVELVEFSVE